MRRIIHNSTAILACLALVAPDLALAQSRNLTLAQNDQAQEPSEEELQLLLEEAQEQDPAEASGETGDEAEPDAAAEEAQQPEGAASPDQPAAVEAEEATEDSDTVPEEEDDLGQALQEIEGEPADEAQAEDSEAAPAETEGDLGEALQEIEGEPADEAQAEDAAQDAAEQPQADAADDASPEDMQPEDSEATPAEPEGDLGEALQEIEGEPADEAQADDMTDDTVEDIQAGEAPLADDEAEAQAIESADETAPAAVQDLSAPMALAQGETAQQRGSNMPGLAQVLAGEVEAGLTGDDLRCLTGEALPCEAALMVTPQGVVVTMNANGRLLLAPSAQQMNRVDDEGRITARAAEEEVEETQSAREAAQEEAAADAAALNEDSSGIGQVFEQLITDANSRSSSEDFTTSLRDALSAAGGQQAATSDDDDSGSDLTRALVLGLGALAVGSALSNNRQVALSSGDRVVVTRPDGSQEIIKDEVALLRQPGSTVTTENFDDGSSRTVVTRPDGSRVVTIRDADLRVLRRTLVSADGNSTRLIDDTEQVQPVDIAALPDPAPVPSGSSTMDEHALAEALRREANINRSFTLGQIRNIPEVRALVPPINIDEITFDTGSAAINPDQARQLSTLGRVLQQAVAENPHEIFLIEGHTDTVGADAMNLALSDRRAESVALALAEYYDVPPENLVVQGYGEQFLKIRAEGDIRENRRASIRRITELLQSAQN